MMIVKHHGMSGRLLDGVETLHEEENHYWSGRGHAFPVP